MMKMMKFYILFVIVIICPHTILSQGNDFVTLEGKQFKLNGANFYPMVMNYNIYITHNQGTSDYYATPASDYGPTSDYECTDQNSCNNRFQIEFAKIKDMGFNCIRVGLGPIYRFDFATNNTIFSMLYHDNLIPFWTTSNQYSNMDYPDFVNQTSQKYFDILTNFLDQADIAGLKVIFVTCEDEGPNATNGYINFNPVYTAQASMDYTVYLTKLASVLSYHTALLAYDLWNEPIYSHMYADETGLLNKQTICSYEREWFDGIKLIDQNHMITLGGSSVDEVFYWDMGSLKLDFYSLHTYPDYSKYLLPNDVQASIGNGIDRFKIICYWMSQVCPMPWIIGETGFAADDNTLPAPQLDSDPTHKLPPGMYGSEAQQTQFALESLDAVRNNLGSGYSWWAFQNVTWFSPSSPCWPDCAPQDFFGLLHYGDGTSNWYDKGAVSVFKNYSVPSPSTNSQPLNYFDPFSIKSTLNTSATNAVFGFITNNKGNPIKDAVVFGTSWLATDNGSPLPGDEIYYHDSPFTFSHADGSFESVPYNYFQPTTSNPHRIVNVRVTAVGAERKCVGSCVWPYGESQMSSSAVNISLNNVTTGFNAFVENEIVNVGETRNYYGWNTLTTTNISIDGNGTIGGNCNFTARESIHLSPGFNAKYGSEVHVFSSEAFSECLDFTNFAKFANPTITVNDDRKNQNKVIELIFGDLKGMQVAVFPNPNSGIFTINISNPIKDHVTLTLKNLLGKLLWETQTTQSEVIGDFDFLPKGIYLLCVYSGKQILTKKVIIT